MRSSRIERIHESLENGQFKQAQAQIRAYGHGEFIADYIAWMDLEACLSCDARLECVRRAGIAIKVGRG